MSQTQFLEVRYGKATATVMATILYNVVTLAICCKLQVVVMQLIVQAQFCPVDNKEIR